MEEKFCKFCGQLIPADAVLCTKCGRQVEQFEQHTNSSISPIIINNNNNNASSASSSAAASSSSNGHYGKACNKWVSLILCLLLGYVGGHKFYEGKIGTGILYLFTCGFFFIGAFIDFFNILGKPNPYYVN